MNGNLSVISQEGKGSVFTLKIPIDIINKEPKLLIEPKRLSKYTIAILNNSVHLNRGNLIKKYLKDFGSINIIELNDFQEDGYDLLFFTPDDEYNEEIVHSKKPSIAILKDSSIILPQFWQDRIKPSLPQCLLHVQSGVLKLSCFKLLPIHHGQFL